jgi:TonB family protein
MNSIWIPKDEAHSRFLFKSALCAFLIEFLIVTAVGWHEHWLAHPNKKSGINEKDYIEAEVFKIPQDTPHLVEEKKMRPSHSQPEGTLSKSPNLGTSASVKPNLDEENKTESGPAIAPTHGPILVYSPPPVIPPYLRDREFKTYVVIDFYISAQGTVSPRLVNSSGNEELDAIALRAAHQWQFRPAEDQHKAIDSKVRLRLIFEVE